MDGSFPFHQTRTLTACLIRAPFLGWLPLLLLMGSFEPATKKARSDIDLSVSFHHIHQQIQSAASLLNLQQQQPTVQQQTVVGDFECRRYTTPEGCPYGTKCRFKHGPFDDRDLTQQTSALGSKTKPCTKFFSTSGCPYGEGCHFLHYVPGGINSLQVQAANGTALVSNKTSGVQSADPAQTVTGYKTRLCNRFNTAEGCRFGEKCHFAHGESDLRPANTRPPNGQQSTVTYINGNTVISANPVATSVYYGEPTPPGVPAVATFGSISVTRMSIEAAYAGAIIGKAGANVKQISKVTGCKVSIRDHETDASMRNVEMEGSIEQIESASEMVRQLLQTREIAPPRGPALGSHNFKTKLCENFSSGTCTFAERCHFAHGTQELRPIIR